MPLKREKRTGFLCCVGVLFIVSSCNLPVQQPTAGNAVVPTANAAESPSREPYWILSIGGSGRDYAPSFLPVEDGYVVAGMTSSFGLGDGGGNQGGSHDFLALKLDRRGSLVWSTVVGGPEDERGSYSVTPASDGGFLLTGTTRSFGAGNTDIFLVKLSVDGGFVWSRTIGGPSNEAGMTTLETDDGYLIVGDTSSFGAGKRDLLAVQLHPDGSVDWAEAIGGAEDDLGSGVAAIGGGYILGGTFWSFGAGEADSALMKIDTRGHILWSRTIGGAGAEGINWDGVRVTRDGGIAFGDKTTSFDARGGGALFGVQLDSSGDLVWSTMIDGPLEDAGWTMNETADGYIAGGKLTLPDMGGDILFVKFDRQGNCLWSRLLGDAGLDEIEEIKPVGGGYVMTGVTRMVDPAGDILVARVDPDGFTGGDSDPIASLEPRTVARVTPETAPFSPKVTDVSAWISVQTAAPQVSAADLQISEIHVNR